MLVLDRSGSMNGGTGFNPGPTSFDDLQYASKEFVGNFDNNRDRLGLVSFGTASAVDRVPATGFKPALPGLAHNDRRPDIRELGYALDSRSPKV